MLIDLSALLRGETKEVPVDYSFSLTEAPDGIEYTAPAVIRGEVTDSGGHNRLAAGTSVLSRKPRCRTAANAHAASSLSSA